ncbi:uncharacterized protein [Coffea arabica]|uniref:Uncharacterized protein LOC113700132 n=1 Tax=Coffea arabica TaxID=13443 RepID=A0A6P6TD43_COFAR|nr:uncharacterized protein LOC113700132 [Coffea arabica]XP_027076423.1 uncharacterized protein LOC113700132 [Coffea arabica]XP_027076424.1 uncharacterized protein LOC113700132 [Coffea arabica]XP_027076425.1 uncharacterized protein LOC113700132 [Coffea arabica]XP_027076426.1 uncharacterized protein LOC113700132 [Coffea arabica]
MALLGDDGRGYELARKLESHGVWRTWLGESLHSSFVHFLASPSAWEAFMRADYPADSSTSSSSSATAAVDSLKTRALLHLQLRARALLFDKASISLFLRSPNNNPQLLSPSSSSNAISKLSPNYLQLHGDDVYFTLEEAAQRSDSVLASSTNATASKSKSSFGVGSRHTESEIGSLPQRFKFDELPETWYAQFFEKYRASKSYRLSFGDQETEKRTPEHMYNYLRVAENHKRKRVAFKVDQNIGVGNSMLDSGSNMLLTSIVEDNNALDDEAPFFPETMFSMNCVPDSAVLQKHRVSLNVKVEFNGILDTLPQIVTKSPIMIERLGIRPEYLSMDPKGNQNRGRIGYDGRGKLLGQEQASQLSQKVIARFLSKVGFEGSSEMPLEVLSQLLSSRVCKLGCTLKLLADSYRKQCSVMELLKMFLHTTGYSNLVVLSELVKDATRNPVPQTQQQVQGFQLQLQSQNQGPIRPSQQIPRQMLPQLQQMINSQNLAFQQHQQWERMRRRQQSTPRPGMNMNINMDKDRPMVEVKVENPSDFPMDNNTFATINSRHSQLQPFRQQQIAAMTSFQTSNQFRPMSSPQIPQMQSPNMGMARAPPVKVEGFQELMGGDATLKHDSEENKLTSPAK